MMDAIGNVVKDLKVTQQYDYYQPGRITPGCYYIAIAVNSGGKIEIRKLIKR